MPKIKSAFVIFGLTVSATANEINPVVAPSIHAHPATAAHPQRMAEDTPPPVVRSWDRGQTRYVF